VPLNFGQWTLLVQSYLLSTLELLNKLRLMKEIKRQLEELRHNEMPKLLGITKNTFESSNKMSATIRKLDSEQVNKFHGNLI